MFRMQKAEIVPSRKVMRKTLRQKPFRYIQGMKDFMEQLDHAGQELLDMIKLPPLEFEIEPTSVANLAMSLILEPQFRYFPACRMLYSARDEDGTVYLLDSSFQKADADQLEIIEVLTRKNRYATAERYDMEKRRWETDRGLDRMLNAEINEAPEASLVQALENGFGVPVAICNTDNICKEFDRNEKLIGLASKLDGFGKLKLFDVQSEKDTGELKLTPVITASDMFLLGTAVMLDDDGKFGIYAFNPDAELREKGGLFYAGKGEIKKIAESDDEDSLASFLRGIWMPKEDQKFHNIVPISADECSDTILDYNTEVM